MNRMARQALKELGITTESYYVVPHMPPAVCPNGHAMDDGYFLCPCCGVERPPGSIEWHGPVWGTAFVREGRDLFVVEHHAHSDTLRRKYILRDVRTEEGGEPQDGEMFSLQRLAVAHAIRRMCG